MEALHAAHERYTYNEYRKFNYFLMGKALPTMIWFAAIIIAFVAMAFCLNAKFGKFLLIAVLIIVPVMTEVKMARMYHSYKSENGQDIELEFCDEYFLIKSENRTGKYAYDMIYKVYESKTNFYIMMGAGHGTSIVKSQCSNKLCDFIRNLKKD